MTEIEFTNTLRKNRLRIEPEKQAQILEYSQLLLSWNEKVNLISRADADSARFTHILHSICLLFFIHIPEGATVLDLGTGGGLPGIPLGILRPDLRIMLVDSIRKKTAVVADMVATLGLTNLSVLNLRAEEMKTRGFQIVLARGVAPLDELIRWAKPLVSRPPTHRSEDPAPGLQVFSEPFLVAWKGGDLTQEIARTRTKHHKHTITTINLVFNGSAEAGLEEKKLVIVEL